MRQSPARRESRRRASALLPAFARRRMRQGRIGQVDEHTLAVAQRRDAHQRANGFDVASCLADEAADIGIRELDLDGDGSTASLECLHGHLLRLVGQRPGYILHQRAVVNTGTGGPWRTLAPEASVVT